MVTSDEQLKMMTESMIVKKNPDEEEPRRKLSERIKEKFHDRLYGKTEVKQPEVTVDQNQKKD